MGAESSQGAGRRRRWLKVIAIALGVVAVLLGVLTLAVNRWLASGDLTRTLNTEQKEVTFRWSRAVMLWPGHVLLEDVVLRGTDRKRVQFQIVLDRAEVDVDVLSLLRRTFHATSLRARGVEYRMRGLVPSEEAATLDAGLLPSIPGFPDPPVRPYPLEHGQIPEAFLHDGQVGPGNAGERPKPKWTVKMEDVVLDEVRELWVQQYKFTGAARIEGQFLLKPKEDVQVGPATITLIDGTLRQGVTDFLTALRGEVGITVYLLHPDERPGLAFLRQVDARVQVDAGLESLRFLEEHLPPFAFTRGRGRIHTSVRVDRGHVLPGSEVTIDTGPAALELRGYRATGAIHGRWHVLEDGKGREGRLRATLSPFALEMPGRDAPVMTAERLVLTGRTTALDLAALDVTVGVGLAVEKAQVPDLRPFGDELEAAGLGLGAGAATVGLALELDRHGVGSGHALLELPKLHAVFKGQPLDGTVKATLLLKRFDVNAETADLSGSSLELSDLLMPGASDVLPGWWAKVRMPTAKVRLKGKLRLEARLVAEARDVRPLMRVFLAESALPGVVRNVFAMPFTHGDGMLTVDGPRLTLDPFEVAGAGSGVRGRLRMEHGAKEGALLLNAGPITLGVGLRDTRTRFRLFGATAWFDEQKLSPVP